MTRCRSDQHFRVLLLQLSLVSYWITPFIVSLLSVGWLSFFITFRSFFLPVQFFPFCDTSHKCSTTHFLSTHLVNACSTPHGCLPPNAPTAVIMCNTLYCMYLTTHHTLTHPLVTPVSSVANRPCITASLLHYLFIPYVSRFCFVRNLCTMG